MAFTSRCCRLWKEAFLQAGEVCGVFLKTSKSVRLAALFTLQTLQKSRGLGNCTIKACLKSLRCSHHLKDLS